MDVEMSDQADLPTVSETLAVGRLRRAYATLTGSEQPSHYPDPTTYSLAQAFCNTEATPLRSYQAASHLREGQLREVVQFLIFTGPESALTILKLLSIMQGLPGNWELTMEFLERQTPESFKSFPTRVFSLIAMLGGKKAFNLCDWSPVVERAFKQDENEARWALSTLSEYLWKGPTESVLRVFEWETELPYENEPSVWREIQWAAYARTLCLSSDAGKVSASENDSDAAEQEETNFETLSSDFGAAAAHYVRICGTLMRRRLTEKRNTLPNNSHPESSGDKKITQDHPVVLTSTIRQTVCDMAAFLSHGVSFILEGPTGCGKTALISFLARKTTYHSEGAVRNSEAPGVTFIQMDSAMLHADGESFASLIGCVVPVPEGGGFRWRPGPIGAAAERGDWIVFENIGRSTGRMSSAAAVIRRLATAKPGDKLDAPGRGEPIIIGRGFRCIATRTLSHEGAGDTWEPPGGWDTWYRITVNDLSFDEKIRILSERHVHIEDCIHRVVTVVDRVAKYAGNLRGPLFRTPTLREAVRICERLDAAKQETGSLSPEIAFLETMDVLAAWCSSEQHFGELSNIVSLCWSLPPHIGADMYSKHRPDLSHEGERVRIGRASAAKATLTRRHEFSRLSLTGHTLRLLERALRCLELGENVLLSGETGSGKTAVIQELASLMGKKLVVVNLSRQSELDDLIGGFRPVDASAAVPLLAKRFESAFCQCMSKQKNADFIDALQRASRSLRHHHRALRLMEGAFKAIPKSSKQRSSLLRQEWEDIATSLEKLTISYSLDNYSYTQLTPKASFRGSETSQEPRRKRPRVSSPRARRSEPLSLNGREDSSTPRKSSRRIDFEFCDGVLVQAMRDGDWILLDELNLAPPELLERLVSILEVGQVTLTDELGDVVSKQDGFVLFGAMNPPTDTGKRPLPSVLRARFSEFHVGDMLFKEDLLDLIVHKFLMGSSPRGEAGRMSRKDTEIANDTVDFYLNSYEMAKQGRIEDSIGKPVRFSLRSLSRMLDFASGLKGFLKNESQGKRRALFEGALAAFSTQLPKKSRTQLTDMAERFLLRKSRGNRLRPGRLVDLMSVPENPGVSVRMLHGFPIEIESSCSDNEIGGRLKFIVTPTVEQTLTDVCRALIVGAPKLPILLQGPTAAGKTSLISYLAEQTGNRLIRINNHEHTEISEYIGGYVATEDGSLLFSEGPLVRAARNGDWVMLDELNLAPPDVLESLNRLLDDNREILIPETAEVVKAARGFRLFATQNPPGLYGGRKELSRAFRSRFIEVQVDELPDHDLETILEKRADIPTSFARRMVAVLRNLQIQRRSSGLFSGREGYITARDLFRWASRGPRCKEELAIHGFLLLAERARSSSERLLVRDVICKETGVALEVLSDENLYAFDLDDDGDDASKQCLDFSLEKLSLERASILRALSERNIVLTPSMRRMLTLLIHCMANEEPTLLVGATGGGKTTSCAAIAAALSRQLLTINCHRHTEASDILGGFRPVRHQTSTSGFFEWVDGPLVEAMKKGFWMLADEINMADDAVIERLNSVLELERTILLSEKGTDKSSTSPEVVVAEDKFRILATMNPGGDFGKKELSPALRNRFTELWIPPPLCIDDYLPIIHQRLGRSPYLSEEWKMASHLVQDTVRSTLSDSRDDAGNLWTDDRSLQVSIRDLTAWCDFIVEASKVCEIDPILAAVHGSRLVFLDGLSVGLTSSHYMKLESQAWQRILGLLPSKTRRHAETARYTEGIEIVLDRREHRLKVDCFYIPCNNNAEGKPLDKDFSSFSFDAPNTVRNTARIARAMCVGYRPVLLEGPPGSGKSSLIAALASASEFKYSRVNLSEGTEMSDLVGCDAPGQDQGTFVFRRGPLLEALTDGSWILLDELNLASQSVLEGLNSVLDHRKTLFVPELNKEFSAHPSFRIFGAQNSATDGGGRRGLPKSFLNRFTRVHIESPGKEDIKSIVTSIHPQLSSKLTWQVIECLHDLRIMNGYGNSRDRFGLRDALRWCDLLSGIGSRKRLWGLQPLSRAQLYTCFDVAILRSLKACERESAESCFERIFGFPCHSLRTSPSLRPHQGRGFRIGSGAVENVEETLSERALGGASTLLVSSRCWELQAMSFAINACWPVTLFSPSLRAARFEAMRLVHQAATLFGKRVTVFDGASLTDAEDFVGGYVQHDAMASMRSMLPGCEELLQEGMNMAFSSRREMREDGNETFRDVYRLHVELKNVVDVASRDQQNMLRSVTAFLLSFHRLIDRIGNSKILGEHLKGLVNVLREQHNGLKQIHGSLITGDFAPFKWRKSDLMNAIEVGEWVFMQDADACPPALLDRLNPIFERAAVSASGENFAEHTMTLSPMILAEAPSNEDGSPVLLQPHPHFRMFFSLSKPVQDLSQCGLSKALLDRSLKLCIEEDMSNRDNAALFRLAGLSGHQWAQTFHKNGKLKDTSVSSDREVSDVLTRAERARFHMRDATTKELETQASCLEKSGSPRRLHTSGFWHSVDDLPFTTVGEYVDNPALSSMERDIASLRILETTPEEAILRFTDRVRQILGSSFTMEETNFLELPKEQRLPLKSGKQMLLESGANAFLFGATSWEDLSARATILRKRAALFGSSVPPSVYLNRSEAMSEYMLSLEQSGGCDPVSFRSRPRIVPLDPLFALDRSSLYLTSLESGIEEDPKLLKHRAKRIRAELLALNGLRRTWTYANERTGDDTFFTRARLTYELQDKKFDVDDAAQRSFECLAFDTVSTAVASIDAYCRLTRTNDTWEVSAEEEWLNFFTYATSLCELMTVGSDPASSSLAVILYNIAMALEGIEDRINPCFGGLLERLHQHLQLFRAKLRTMLLASKRDAIPTSRQGQELEAVLMQSIANSRRKGLSVTQIDAIVNGLATLFTQHYDREEIVLAELRKVVEFITQKSSPGDARTFVLDHWSNVVRHMGIRVAQDALTATDTQELLQPSAARSRNEGLQIFNDCMSYMKCLPHSSMTSLAYMQKLRWIVESTAPKQSQSTCMMPSHDDIVLLASLGLLCELNSLFSLQDARQDDGTNSYQQRMETVSSTLILAKGSFAVPFWTLSQAYAEAACTAALISRGRHRIDHINETSKLFLQRCMKSIYHNKSTMGEEMDGIQLFNRTTIVDPLGRGEDCESETEEDLPAIVNCAVSDDNSLSETDKILRFGKAWVSLGVTHLSIHYGFMKQSRGIDPAQFSQSISSLAFQEMLSLSAASLAYSVIGSHRLGGDSFPESAPAERFARAEEVKKDIVLKASGGNVFRSSEKSDFQAYESFVDKVHATVTRRIVDTGLISKLHTKHSPTRQEQVVLETIHLTKSCEALSHDLICEGSFGHFRDISTNLALGLQEVQYGFYLFRRASEKCSIALLPELEKHSAFVSDMLLFPRAAHKQSAGALNSLELCMSLPVDADCIMALANYLVSCDPYTSDCSGETSLVLSKVVSEWKKRSLADEREVEKKESLHILREAGRREMIPGGDVVDRLGMDEDEDFAKTFDPISPDEEEELCGLPGQQTPKPFHITIENHGKEREEDLGRRISPESFWYLHKKVYPPLEGADEISQTLSDRVQQLTSLSSHLYSLTSGVLPVIDNVPSVWETFASYVVSRKLAISSTHTNSSDNLRDAPYNFYTDANIAELVKASGALQSLRSAISRVQHCAFNETGNHPVLDEVDSAIQRIAKVCQTSTPLSRVVLGIENVLRKADEWQRLFATSNTRLDAYVLEVAKIVARWRRLEVQSWPLLLQSREAACEKHACRWIFLLYDAVVHEGMQTVNEDPECIRDVISSVDQFLRSSSQGEFGRRLEMVRSLGRHVLARGNKNGEPVKTLGQSLIGLAEYYRLFLSGVHREIADAKQGVEKELSEFTRLTSWNASHDLGSSCKMFKEKDKYLQYYRLKTAAEKTRRKLHKLCLKVDSIVKAPVHQSLLGQLSKVGFFRSIGEEGNPTNKETTRMSFSDRIRAASQLLTQSLVSERTQGQRMTRPVILGEKGSLLSQVFAFEEKLAKLGNQVENLGYMKCELAAKFSIQLRSSMRDRISQLRDTGLADIQVKKRALVELFKILRITGISPFEPSTRLESHQWLSAPNPSLCGEYNAVANELFWKSAMQIQRLQEVSDTRVRSPDLTNDDASKLRAFCQRLFDQACTQRRVLSEIFDDVHQLTQEANALNRLKFDKDTHSQLHGIISSSYDPRHAFVKLQEISIDLLASEEIFKQVVRQIQQTKSMFRGSTDQVEFLIEIHSKDSVEVLNGLETILTAAVTAVKETVAHQELTSFERKRGSSLGFMDSAYSRTLLKATEKLSKLATVLGVQYSKARNLAPDSFVTLVLTPVLSFVQDSLNSLNSPSTSRYRGTPGFDYTQIWSQINEDGNAIVQTILIGSQRILAWNDLNVTTEGLQNKNDNATLEDYSLNDLSRPGLMKSANAKVLSLSSAVNVSELLQILRRNADSIRVLSKNNVDFEKMDRALSLQQSLARFVTRYLNTMIVPCLQKASQFHAHSLSLLRSLSSVFIGLCVEGFCRPPEHDNDSGENCEVDGSQGGGFGDAGDGDLSSAQNVSDQIEDEEQLLGLRDDAKNSNDGVEPQKDKDEDQDGVDMTADFDGEMQDLNDEQGTEGESDEGEDEMAPESGVGNNVIDERIWGDSDKPETDNQGQEKDKEAEKSDTNNGTSEIVAKKEENERTHEGQRNSDHKEEGQKHAPEDMEAEEESGMEEEKKDAKNETEEEGKRETFGNQKENPFNIQNDIDSDDGEEQEDKNATDDPIGSQDPAPRRSDDSALRDQDSPSNDVEIDNDGDSNSAPSESDAVDHETQSVLSDGADRDEGQEDAMLGVEEPKNGDQTNEDAANGPSAEMPDVPVELNLEDCTDSGNASEEEGDNTSMEKSADNYKDDIEFNEEDIKMDTDDFENERDTLNQRHQNLSRQGQAMAVQPKNGNHAAGNETMDEMEETMANDQGECGDGFDDRDSPAQHGEKDVNATVGGSGLRGLKPAAGQPLDGDVRQDVDSLPSVTNKDNSFKMNPNPLRANSPEELVEAWERHLKVMEKEQEDRGTEPSTLQRNEADGLWEYQEADQAHEESMHTLGAATEDQHRPLNVDDEEGNSSNDPAKDMLGDQVDATTDNAPSQPSTGMDGNTERRDHGEEGKASVPEALISEEDYQTSLKSHPAHKASEGVNEGVIPPTLQPQRDTHHEEEVPDRMEVEKLDESKKEGIPSSQINDKLTWQMETLDEKTAMELWHRLDMKVSAGASTLCEQLRLVLEPTVVSGLSGGYRTGKRLNMRKVIEYVASDFQKDRIWLRRVKPDKRSYNVLVAIDDSASMAESEAGAMAIESLALVLSALSKLEIGRVGVARFGAEAEMIRDFDEPLPLSVEGGGKLLQQFSFSQRHTDVVKLLSFIQVKMGDNFGLGDVEHVSLAFIISDGRLSNREEVRRQLRHLKSSNVLIAFVILDQVFGEQTSIYEVKRVDYDNNGNMTISPYMEDFPIDFYTTVKDIRCLPAVLGDALRQWVEAANA